MMKKFEASVVEASALESVTRWERVGAACLLKAYTHVKPEIYHRKFHPGIHTPPDRRTKIFTCGTVQHDFTKILFDNPGHLLENK